MYTIYTKANRLMPANQFNIEAEHILCNDVTLPREFDEASRYNPHNVRAWLIGHMYGAVCMVWASCEQDALDNAVDANMLDCMLVDDADLVDYDFENNPSEYCFLGNASEAFDLADCWMAEVDFQLPRDSNLVIKLARASEGGYDTLDF